MLVKDKPSPNDLELSEVVNISAQKAHWRLDWLKQGERRDLRSGNGEVVPCSNDAARLFFDLFFL